MRDSFYDTSISTTVIDNTLWQIKHNLMIDCGCAEAERLIAPLEWYIRTDRASLFFLRSLVTAKPYTIIRRLKRGGSYAEVIDSINNYFNHL